MTIMMATLTSMIMATMLMMMFWKMTEEKKESKDSKTSFECGYMSMSASKMNFSTNFIMVIMMFLIFDIEISILIVMTMKSSSSMMESTLSVVFLLAVTLILTKEWWMGSVDWNS